MTTTNSPKNGPQTEKCTECGGNLIYDDQHKTLTCTECGYVPLQLSSTLALVSEKEKYIAPEEEVLKPPEQNLSATYDSHLFSQQPCGGIEAQNVRVFRRGSNFGTNGRWSLQFRNQFAPTTKDALPERYMRVYLEEVRISLSGVSMNNSAAMPDFYRLGSQLIVIYINQRPRTLNGMRYIARATVYIYLRQSGNSMFLKEFAELSNSKISKLSKAILWHKKVMNINLRPPSTSEVIAKLRKMIEYYIQHEIKEEFDKFDHKEKFGGKVEDFAKKLEVFLKPNTNLIHSEKLPYLIGLSAISTKIIWSAINVTALVDYISRRLKVHGGQVRGLFLYPILDYMARLCKLNLSWLDNVNRSNVYRYIMLIVDSNNVKKDSNFSLGKYKYGELINTPSECKRINLTNKIGRAKKRIIRDGRFQKQENSKIGGTKSCMYVCLEKDNDHDDSDDSDDRDNELEDGVGSTDLEIEELLLAGITEEQILSGTSLWQASKSDVINGDAIIDEAELAYMFRSPEEISFLERMDKKHKKLDGDKEPMSMTERNSM